MEQNEHFNSVKFVNLSISSLGVFGKECSTFIEMLNDLGFQKQHQIYCIRRMTTIAIRACIYKLNIHLIKFSLLLLLHACMHVFYQI